LIRALLATGALLLALPAVAGAARSLYVVNGPPANDISIFDVATGAPMAPGAGVTTPFSETTTGPAPVAMTPDGAHLYTGNAGPPAIILHTVAANGALTDQTMMSAGFVPAGISVSADGDFLYATNSVDNTISANSVGPDGALTELSGSPFPAGTAPMGIASTPDGKYLYVTNSGGSTLSGYEIAADGRLTELPDSPFAVDAGPQGISITPDGRFLYVVTNSADSLWGFAIEADGGLGAVPGSPWAAQGTAPTGTAISPDGKNLFYTVDDVAGTVVSTAIGSDGAIGVNKLAVTGDGPRTVVAHPNGADIYVAADDPNQLFSYSYGATGELTPLGAPAALSNGTQAFQGAVVTPNQGPVAAFSQGTTPASVVATFNANASTDDTGIASYRWDFGDGKTQTTTIPTVSHKYATNGTYHVTLRVTDVEGCSVTRVYTGQTVLCNGGPAAQVTKTIDTAAPPPDNNRVTKPSLTMKASQAQGKKRIKVKVKVGAGEAARIKLRGYVRQSKVKVQFKKQTVEVRGTNRRSVTLKLKGKHADKKVRKLIRKAGAVRATVIANYKDEQGNKAKLSDQTALHLKKKRR
jgi:6-phosphogluconolactonase (cycloisomerase 2 family)